jgi:hypothetical protein
MTEQSDTSEKTNKLTKVDKFYIAGHRDKNPKVLSKELGKSTKLVKQYLDFLTRREQNSKQEEVTTPIKPEGQPAGVAEIKSPIAGDLLAKRKGTVVMTPAASEIGDANRQKNKMSQRLAKNVTKIRPE